MFHPLQISRTETLKLTLSHCGSGRDGLEFKKQNYSINSRYRDRLNR